MDSFFFQSIVPFESKYKRPTKNKTKSLLQDTKDQNTTTLKEQTLAIQYPTKSEYCNQQVPFFDPSFLSIKNTLFFLPLRRYPNNNRNYKITTKTRPRFTKNLSLATK